MKKKVLNLFSFVGLMIASLVFLGVTGGVGGFSKIVSADGEQGEVTTSSYSYLLNKVDGEQQPYLSNLSAGTTTGYGQFLVGATDIELSAIANTGFVVTGWRLEYGNTNATVTYLSTSNNTLTDADNDGKWEFSIQIGDSEPKTVITFTVTFSDTDGDSFVDSSALVLSDVFEDISISPVYDYIYSNVDITAFVEILSDATENSIAITSVGTLYYFEADDESVTGYTIYSQAILLMDGKYYYFGQVYGDGMGGYFTRHYTSVDTNSTAQYVDINTGAFRFNDTVDFSFDIKNSASVSEPTSGEININLTSASITENGTTTALTLMASSSFAEEDTACYYVEQDEYLRSTAITLRINISNTTSKIISLGVEYDNLYVVTIDAQVDEGETNIDTEIKQMILSSASFFNTYSTIEDTNGRAVYFVRNATQNGGNSFKINCADPIWKTVEGVTYRYYNFASIDNEQSSVVAYADISDNFSVMINYTSQLYTISFEFLLWDETSAQAYAQQGSFSLENSEQLSRGLSTTISKTDMSDNVGYTFYAFSLSDTVPNQKNTSIDVVIDETKPQNITVYMIYTYTQYTLTLYGFNSKSLTDSVNTTIYALNKIDLSQVKGTTTYGATAYASNLTGQTYYPFSTSVIMTINDIITLSATTNSGFEILGYKFSADGSGDLIESDAEGITASGATLTFTLSSSFLDNANYVSNNNISIYIVEEYIYYSLTYYIEAKTDTSTSEKAIMADLTYKITKSIDDYDVSANVSETYTYVSGGETYKTDDFDTANASGSDVKYVITLTKLRLYDVVILSAEGVTTTGTSPYTYSFTRFTANDRTSLTPVKTSDDDSDGVDTYSYTATIENGNLSIKVIYSMPSARLIVSIASGFEEAFTLYNEDDSYNFTISGATYTVDEDNVIILEANSEITLTIKSGYITFGYSFDGITIVKGSDGNILKADGTGYGCVIELGTGQTEIQLDFKLIEFYFYITQSGGTDETNGKGIDYDNDGYLDDYKIVTVKDLSIDFTMPTGYYVSYATVNKSEYSAMEQNNDYSGDQFSFEFTTLSLSSLIDTYGTTTNADNGNLEIYVVLTYTIHMYTISVEFELTNPKNNANNERITYPAITITYDDLNGSISGTWNNENLTLTFTEAVPYGAKNVTLNVGSLQEGLRAYGSGWTDTVYTKSSTYLTVPEMLQDLAFEYKISYILYNLNLVIDVSLLDDFDANTISSVASPVAYVYGEQNSTVSIYDSFEIYANASTINGYSFVCFYLEYRYDADTWAQVYNLLYVYSSGEGYVLNSSEIYDENTTYFVMAESTTDGVYVDEDLVISDYYVADGDYLNFYIVFSYLELTIKNFNSNYSGTLTGVGDLKISADDYSDFVVYVNGEIYSENDVVVEDATKTTINILDTVKIYVTLKNNVDIGEKATIDLSTGLSLVGIYVASTNYYLIEYPDEGETWSFAVSFDVKDVINSGNITQEGSLVVEYQYSVNKFTINYTTNITSEDFYRDDGQNRFLLTYNFIPYKFSLSSGESEGESSLSSTLQFLGKADFSYSFKNSNGETYYYADGGYYFEIKSIKVYSSTKQLIAESDYSKYGVSVTYSNDLVSTVTVRYVANITIELQVSPVIHFNNAMIDGNGNYWYSSVFVYDQYGTGISQGLSVGTTSSSDISASDYILQFLKTDGVYNISYYDANNNAVAPTNAGIYTVKLSFNKTGDYDWLSQIDLNYNIYFEITQKTIYITYNISEKLYKTYNGSSSYDVSKLLQYLVITDNAGLEINYVSDDCYFTLNLNYLATITYTYNQVETTISSANENIFYNIKLENLAFTNTTFNNNFALGNSDSVLIMYNVIQIQKKELTITGIQVYDKVYDGTTSAQIRNSENIQIYGVVKDDDVSLVDGDIELLFENAQIGLNKNVTVNSLIALSGDDASNYTVSMSSLTASIYPYSVSADVEGYGTITIVNDRGLVDSTYASLIPIGVSLQVSVIEQDEYEYRNLYQYFSNLLTSNERFVVGYKLSFLTDGGLTTDIDNNLYVCLPNVERLLSAISLTGEVADELSYTVEGNEVKIDLSQVSLSVDTLILTQQRLLLKWWQILLIVLLLGLIIGLIVTVIVVIRKKKERSYRVHEKI